jgi:hypothetical protein
LSQFVDGSIKSFIAGAAIARFLRVKLVTGQLQLAGLVDKELGVLRDAAFAAGDQRAVILRNKQGTIPMVANGAIAAGGAVFTAASGKVGVSTSTGFLIGTALEAAAADGDIIEVLPNVHGDTVVP